MSEITVPLTADTITKEEIDKLRDWLGTYPKLTKGDLTLKFEREWSDELGIAYSTFVNSGSSAILLVLSSMIAMGKLRPGIDSVVVPSLSWLTDVSSPINLGLDIHLCDANPEDLSMDLDHLERICSSNTNVKAVILVSVLGLSPDMDRVMEIKEEYDFYLIEDVCESLGTDFRGKLLGKFGYASVYSLFYGHHISTIEGGMISTDDQELDSVIRSMRSHGWNRDWPDEMTMKKNLEHSIDQFHSKYTFFYPGYNLRSTDLQAYLGLMQIGKIRTVAKRRHDNFMSYQRLIGHMNQFTEIGKAAKRSTCVSNFAYPMLFRTNEEREIASRSLDAVGIEHRPLIAGSMAKQPFMRSLGLQNSTPFADLIHSNGMYLPNNHSMTEQQIKIVANALSAISPAN